MSRFDVSVVIPTHDRRTMLERAINSCFRGNENLSIEVIVVDDGSRDGTGEFLRKLKNPNVRFISQKQSGVLVARNKGFKKATGKYVKYLDDDDWLVEGALTKEVEKIEQEGADISVGNQRIVYEDGRKSERINKPTIQNFLLAAFTEDLSPEILGYLFNREYLIRHGIEWNEDLPYSGDVEYIFDVALTEPKFSYLNQYVANYAKHGQIQLTDQKSAAEHSVTMLKRYGSKIPELLEKELTIDEKDSVARQLWFRLHMASAFSLSHFYKYHPLYQKLNVNNTYPPRSQKLISFLDKIGSPMVTETLLYPFRKLKHTMDIFD